MTASATRLLDEGGFGVVVEQCAYGICLDLHQSKHGIVPPCPECMEMARKFVEAASEEVANG